MATEGSSSNTTTELSTLVKNVQMKAEFFLCACSKATYCNTHKVGAERQQTSMEQSAAQIQQDDFSHFQLIQQPGSQSVTLLQQLPSVMSPPPLRPGHIREDLVELMMMQNAQMHQVIMNNMTMSALSSFGYMQAPEHPGPPVTAELDPEVYHHHYPYPPCVSYPVWAPTCLAPMQSYVPLQTISSFQEPTHYVETEHRDMKAVPPSPPSATGTLGPDVPPAAEYYEGERRQQRKEETELKQKQ